ncbi:hypothetical protein [Rhodanobacter lindaniclasticus]|jgi:hypothetical protein|uniref:hypothetical protein n=1 Tax=Rhodanobacter lindaniclasticus TaxID=75310 RepID=UPI00109FBDD3|nr:hypothetical protein [Rhodanobacter lindaniclasticus]
MKKRIALSVAFGIALAATSALASAGTPAAGSSDSVMDAISNWFACAIGSQSCVSPDTTTDPRIKNN